MKKSNNFSDKVRLLTFQSKKVLEEVNKYEISYPLKESRFQNAPKTYEHLIKDYNQMKNKNVDKLFFGWVKVLEEVEELTFSEEILARCTEMTKPPSDEEVVILLLEVPEDIVLVTNFYNYSDEMYSEEFPKALSSVWDSIYDLDTIEQQGVIPYITKDMIIDFKEL